MGAIVHHNLPAGYARLNLSRAYQDSAQSIERLSSGFRLNHPKDETGGYALSQRLKSDLAIYEQVRRNAQTGMTLTRAIESTSVEVLDVLDRMRELALSASTDTMTNTDRVQAQVEFGALQGELNRLANTQQVNNISGLATSGTLTFQTGIREGQHNLVVLTLSDMRPGALSLSAGLVDVSTQANAQSSIDSIESALDRVINYRTRIGARYRELEVAFDVGSNQMENISRTNAVIRDTDYAMETGDLVQAQVRMQAGASILSQANEMSRLALQLLRR